MKLIFDFDHTIFDMTSMHDAIMDSMASIGISKETYLDAYQMETNWKAFTVSGVASRLEKMAKADPEKVHRAYHKVAEVADLFVYDDVLGSFQDLRDDGHVISLLSWGDQEWQNKKIHHSGLKDEFEEVITVNQLKADYLGDWCKGEKYEVVVIDDKPAELKAIQQKHPEFHLVRLRRENGKYTDQDTPEGIHEAKDMKQVVDLVQMLHKINA
jgi:hypothetical protein